MGAAMGVEPDVRALEAMSTEDLRKLHGETRLLIGEIGAALVDRTRQPTRDAPQADWDAYHQWKRRATDALGYKKRTLHEIKLLLTERQFSGVHRKRPPDPASVDPASVDAQGPEALVLEAYRVIRHLLGDGADLPPTLDERDRDALAKLAGYVRRTFGKAAVGAFCRAGTGE